MGRDPYEQRESERAQEDDDYARQQAQERADRAADHTPPRPITLACYSDDHGRCNGTTALQEKCMCRCHA